MLCERTGSVLKVIPIKKEGSLDINAFDNILSKKTKLVVVNHVSNALGLINPIKEIIDKAHDFGSKVLIDGAQSAAHFKTDLQLLDIDFYVTSAHKLCGPTGVGFLYGKESLLNELPPFQGGGEMISDVTFQKTTYADLPHKFEAGTPNISGGIAFGYALDYLNEIGLEDIANYENELLKYCSNKLSEIGDIEIYGNSINKIAVISFNVKGIHAYDIGSILDKLGIAVRTGQHCAQPIMDFYQIPGTVRVSFSFYNTKEEIDFFILGLQKAIKMLR
jgi:cysteine desulfurase/selenocysteine lyase